MSECKSSKPELIAIYRLEFYKKQKNWKLCSSRHDKKETSKKPLDKKPNLNQTYNIEDSDVKEISDQLNVAFVDYKSENGHVLDTHPLVKTFSKEWQEPVNILPEIAGNQPQSNDHKQNVDVEKCYPNGEKTAKRSFTMQRLQELHNAVKLQGYKVERNKQSAIKDTDMYLQGYSDCNDFDQNISEHVSDKVDYDWSTPYWDDDYCDEDNWTVQSGLGIGAGHMAQDLCSGEPGYLVGGVYPSDAAYSQRCFQPSTDGVVHSRPWLLPSSSDRHAVTPGLFNAEEKWCDLSVDSVGEFMRGADAAPHSSEIELEMPTLDIRDVSFTSLSRLSSQQLLEAARLHSQVLRKLLLETKQREMLRGLALNGSSIEEQPTRDQGLCVPPHRPYQPHADVVLAGSHMSGRGRGRLPA